MISLKKVIAKKEVFDIIHLFYQKGNKSFWIEDSENNILFGNSFQTDFSFPIIVNKEIIGYVKGGENLIEMVNIISYVAKIENDKKEVIKDALEKYKQLILLYDFSIRVNELIEIKEIADLIIEEANNHFDFDEAYVKLVNEEYTQTVIISSTNKESENSIFDITVENDLVQHIVKSKNAEFINNTKIDNKFKINPSFYASVLVSPIKSKSKLMGIIEFYSKKTDNFLAMDLKIINSIASQSAVAIENASILESLEKLVNKRTLELKVSEDRYRSLIANLGEGVAIANFNEEFIFGNPVVNQIFGIQNGSIVGRNLKEFIDAKKLEAITNETQKRKTGERSLYELSIIREDNKLCHIMVTATPYTDEHGNIIGTLGIFRDITERKNLELDLRKAKDSAEIAYQIIENKNREINDAYNKILKSERKIAEINEIMLNYIKIVENN